MIIDLNSPFKVNVWKERKEEDHCKLYRAKLIEEMLSFELKANYCGTANRCRNHISLSMQALKVNQVCQWLKKAYRDPEDKTVNQDYLANQVHK